MKILLPATKYTKGFTLIELLVVIAIIAILAVVGITVFSGQQQSGRDARRKSDIRAITKALEGKKAPNSATYTALATTDFASGIIPIDTTPAKYSVCYTQTAGTVVTGVGYNPPTTWAAAAPNPTAVVTNCQGGVAWVDVSSTAPSSTATAWTICARLENGVNQFYCLSNAQ